MTVEKPIMDPHHWPGKWSDPSQPGLASYRRGMVSGQAATRLLRKMLTGETPVSVAAFGDAEAALLGYDRLRELPGVSEECLSRLAERSGFVPAEFAWARQEMREFLRHCSLALVMYCWPLAERIQAEAFTSQGVGWQREYLEVDGHRVPKVDVHTIYRLQEHGALADILAGQQVLVVSGYAEKVAARLACAGFRTRHGLPDFEVTGALQVPGRFQPKKPYWTEIRSQFTRGDWTLALLSCGGLAFPLANAAHELGRKAVDWGKVDLCILGDEHPHTHGFEITGKTLSNDGEGI